MADRCRLCTTNDRDGLIEQLAAEMWLSRVSSPWETAGAQWQETMRQFAEDTLRLLERGHD